MGGRLTKNITVPKNMGGNVYCIFPEKCKNLRTSRVNQMFGDVLLSYLEINDLMVCLAIGYPQNMFIICLCHYDDNFAVHPI